MPCPPACEIPFTKKMMALRDRWFLLDRRVQDLISKAVQKNFRPSEFPLAARHASLERQAVGIRISRLALDACEALPRDGHEWTAIPDIPRGKVVFALTEAPEPVEQLPAEEPCVKED